MVFDESSHGYERVDGKLIFAVAAFRPAKDCYDMCRLELMQ